MLRYASGRPASPFRGVERRKLTYSLAVLSQFRAPQLPGKIWDPTAEGHEQRVAFGAQALLLIGCQRAEANQGKKRGSGVSAIQKARSDAARH